MSQSHRRATRGAAAALAIATLMIASTCGEEAQQPVPIIAHGDLITACVAATSCGVKAYPAVQNCVEAYYTNHRPFGLGRVYDVIYACVNRAQGDCDKVYECFGAHELAGRCGSDYVASCASTEATFCDLLDKRVFHYQCSLAGLTCVVRAKDSFESICGLGSCSSKSFKIRCEDNKRLNCEDGVIAPYDCAAIGQKCGSNKGTVTCIGSSSTSCSSSYKSGCKGSVASSCLGGKVQQEDCSKRHYNTTCKAGACVPGASTCDKAHNKCSGADLLACLDGSWRKFDCKALGFGACKAATFGAACAPLK